MVFVNAHLDCVKFPESSKTLEADKAPNEYQKHSNNARMCEAEGWCSPSFTLKDDAKGYVVRMNSTLARSSMGTDWKGDIASTEYLVTFWNLQIHIRRIVNLWTIRYSPSPFIGAPRATGPDFEEMVFGGRKVALCSATDTRRKPASKFRTVVPVANTS